MQSEARNLYEKSRFNPEMVDENVFEELPAEEDILETALVYMESGHLKKADELLTVALLGEPHDHRLWLAAGLVRLRLGYVERAGCAFKMASWLTNDPEARALLELCDGPFV